MKTPFFVQARRPSGQTSRPKVPQSVRSSAAEAARGIVELLRATLGMRMVQTRQGDGVGNVDHSPAVALDEGEGPDRAAGRLRRLDRGAMSADFEGDADVLASTSTPCAPWLKRISSYGQRVDAASGVVVRTHAFASRGRRLGWVDGRVSM